ncbi:MAG TPA: hypothetical protein VFX37_15125 [Pseudolabrys sp.]|nr:hypothetical protein [Pseudolabrys sp.]
MSATGYLDACGFIPASSGTVDFVVSAAITGYQTPASAGAVNGTVYSYRAESADKSQWEEGFGAYTESTTTLARTTITANSSGTTSKIDFSAAPNVFIVAASADLQDASLLKSGTLPAARIAFAAKSDQTTATSTTLPVSPGVQQYHPSASKAWASFKYNGSAIVINDSNNISSITRNSVGDYTVNFTTAFANSGYVVIGTTTNYGGTAPGVITLVSSNSTAAPTLKSTTQVRLCAMASTNSTLTDFGEIDIAFFGTQ